MQWDGLSRDTRNQCLATRVSCMWLMDDEETAFIVGPEIDSFSSIRLTNRECRDWVFSHIFDKWHIDVPATHKCRLSFKRRRFCVQLTLSKPPRGSRECGRMTSSSRQWTEDLVVCYPQRTLSELLGEPLYTRQDVPTITMKDDPITRRFWEQYKDEHRVTTETREIEYCREYVDWKALHV